MLSGSGKCDAWSKLLINVIRTQGIDAKLCTLTPPQLQPGQLLAAIHTKFPDTYAHSIHDPSLGLPVTIIMVNKWDVSKPWSPIDLDGLPAQGMKNPRSYFSNHAVVIYKEKFYDPSYGSITFNTVQEWENASLAAIGILFETDVALPTKTEVKPKLGENTYIWAWKPKQKDVTECNPTVNPSY